MNGPSIKELQRRYRLRYSVQDADCGPRALAIACDREYEIALEACKQNGWQCRSGMSTRQLKNAARALGFYMLHRYDVEGSVRDVLDRLKHDRAAVKSYIVVAENHAIGVNDGVAYDFAARTEWEVKQVFQIRRLKWND